MQNPDKIEEMEDEYGPNWAGNQPEKLEFNELIAAEPLPPITAKPGWQTSQVQLTAIFVVICTIAAFFGYNRLTPDKLQFWYDAFGPLIAAVLPLILGLFAVNNTVNSRGKIASNRINANAALLLGKEPAIDGQQMALGFLGGKFGKAIGGILGNPVTKAVLPTAIDMLPGGAAINRVLKSINGQEVPVADQSDLAELIIANQIQAEANAAQRHAEIQQNLKLINDYLLRNK